MPKRRCIVPQCNLTFSYGMFTFPSDVSRKKSWLEALELDSHRPGDRVCFNHFRERFDFCKKANGVFKLAYDAIPSLYLPNTSTCHISVRFLCCIHSEELNVLNLC